MIRKLGRAFIGMMVVSNLVAFGILLNTGSLSAAPFMNCDPDTHCCKCFHFPEYGIHQCVQLEPSPCGEGCEKDGDCEET
jgi:hypothetical protein